MDLAKLFEISLGTTFEEWGKEAEKLEEEMEKEIKRLEDLEHPKN